MSIISASSGAGTGSGSSSTTYTSGFTSRPVITLANTEQAIVLPVGTKAFMLKNVGTVAVRYAYNAGDTATAYITMSPHSFSG